MSTLMSYSGPAGEHLVLGMLLRQGISAYLAQGPTQKGWDIIFRKGDNLKTIQVKTISWPKEKAVNGKLTADFDFLIVVLLDKENTSPRYLILHVYDVEQHISPENPSRKNRNARTLTISETKLKENGTLRKYESNWKILMD